MGCLFVTTSSLSFCMLLLVLLLCRASQTPIGLVIHMTQDVVGYRFLLLIDHYVASSPDEFDGNHSLLKHCYGSLTLELSQITLYFIRILWFASLTTSLGF